MDDLRMMHSFINDFWQFIKVNFDATDAPDSYWPKVVEEVSGICKKYDNHPAVVKTLCGYLDYLEHEGCEKEQS